MIPCSRCGAPARPASACPSCGAAVERTRPSFTVAAAVLGLAVACTGTPKETGETGDTGPDTTVQPLYGVTTTDYADADTDADTDSDADADADADSDADADADADTDSDADTDTAADTGVEPPYGVPTQ